MDPTKNAGVNSGPSLLCEPVSLKVAIVIAIATSCDAVILRNRQDLIQSLVPNHYVRNTLI